jgi:hypothetical protein
LLANTRRQNMAKIILTFQVEDVSEWEKAFRTHGELFRDLTVISPWSYASSGKDNEIVLYAEVRDLDTCFKAHESPAMAEARAFDGVKLETVKFLVLDKEFHF